MKNSASNKRARFIVANAAVSKQKLKTRFPRISIVERWLFSEEIAGTETSSATSVIDSPKFSMNRDLNSNAIAVVRTKTAKIE